MKIKVPNNTAQLGVEISDLNLSGEFSDDQIAEIRKSWTEYGVAIFPDQKLTHDNFEKFSLLFSHTRSVLIPYLLNFLLSKSQIVWYK